MKAYSLIRQAPPYRREAFESGLKACGFDVRAARPTPQNPCDVFLIWNRYWDNDITATEHEKRGGRVLVAENGYLGMDWKDRRRYALALHGHNGSGQWPSSGVPLPAGAELGSRFAELGYALAPWRTQHSAPSTQHILVCPNRAFGMKGLAMPPNWANDVIRRLRMVTKRPIRLRAHPGNDVPKVPLERDLENCWAVVIWASSAGVHALRHGVPVICESPWWICKQAAGASLAQIENPPMDAAARLDAFQRLAWAQWHLEEITSGLAFRHLLQLKG